MTFYARTLNRIPIERVVEAAAFCTGYLLWLDGGDASEAEVERLAGFNADYLRRTFAEPDGWVTLPHDADLDEWLSEVALSHYHMDEGEYPEALTSAGARAIYDRVERDLPFTEELVNALHELRDLPWLNEVARDRAIADAILETLTAHRWDEDDVDLIEELMFTVRRYGEFYG